MCQKKCCHCAKVAKDFQCCTTDCVFCNVIALLAVESRESLGTRLGSGHETICIEASLVSQLYSSLFPVGGVRRREKYVWTL